MPPASGELIDQHVRSILERDEFRGLADDSSPSTELISELLASIERMLRSLANDLGVTHPLIVLGVLALGLGVLGASIWLGARGAARRTHGEDLRSSGLAEILTGDPVRLRRDAEAAAVERRYLDAVRLLFRAAIIERALREGALERVRDAEAFRRARTYRELIEEFARGDAQSDRMRQLSARIELGLYAGVELGPDDWEAARQLARDLR